MGGPDAPRARCPLLRALEALAEALLVEGRPALAVPVAEEALQVDPIAESGYRLLMEAQASGGNRGAALKVYERCRRALAQELGIGPSPHTEAAYLTILRNEQGERGLRLVGGAP